MAAVSSVPSSVVAPVCDRPRPARREHHSAALRAAKPTPALTRGAQTDTLVLDHSLHSGPRHYFPALTNDKAHTYRELLQHAILPKIHETRPQSGPPCEQQKRPQETLQHNRLVYPQPIIPTRTANQSPGEPIKQSDVAPARDSHCVMTASHLLRFCLATMPSQRLSFSLAPTPPPSQAFPICIPWLLSALYAKLSCLSTQMSSNSLKLEKWMGRCWSL